MTDNPIIKDEDRIRLFHNMIAPGIMESIIKGNVQVGGGPTDILVMLESIVAGVITYISKPGHEGEVMAQLSIGALHRVPDVRKKVEDLKAAAALKDADTTKRN